MSAVVHVTGCSCGGTWRAPDDHRPSATATTVEAATSSSTPATLLTTAVDPTDSRRPSVHAAPGGRPRHAAHYVVEVEDGIPVDPATLAAAVDATLADPGGWTAAGRHVAAPGRPREAPSFRVRLATPATVDAHRAPLQTAGSTPADREPT